MESFCQGNYTAIRLDPGDLVLECLEQVVDQQKIHTAVVVSGIGTLSDAHLHMVTTTGYPAVEHHPVWKDTPLELCSIDGIIASGVPHLHTVISDGTNTWGGHLERGCKTLYLCEIVLEAIPNMRLKRIQNSKKINELKLDETL